MNRPKKEELKNIREIGGIYTIDFTRYIDALEKYVDQLEKAFDKACGELAHELKGDWCWWKKTQPPVDGQRVLEELVDIWHFVMTWELFQDARGIDFIMKKYNFYINRFGTGITGSVGYFIANVDYEFEKLPMLLDLTERLGFSFDEVYQEYINKNRENYDRLARGY